MTATVKCVVWDLDGTLWDGVLLEGDEVVVRPEVVDVIRRLDEVGILHSIASRNDPDQAMARLTAAGLADYFLHPQIGWNPKSLAVQDIAAALNIGVDSLAFVDDQPFELAEVASAVPAVLCVPVDELAAAVERPEFQPRFVTDESRRRRAMYQSGVARDTAEREHVGTSEAFLATLEMRMRIAPAEEDDLQRAEELTIRTNQLNSTGRTYGYEELDAFRTSPDHLLLVASLDDRFGSYGKIGLALIETGAEVWNLRLLLMSCRVVSRGVGTVLLNHVMGLARAAGVALRSEFVANGRNRMMHITFKFAGFRQVAAEGDLVVLEASLEEIQPPPSYLTLVLS